MNRVEQAAYFGHMMGKAAGMGKRAEESFANKTTNSPLDGLNKGIMEGGEKYPGQFMSLANPANNKTYFNNHNMPRAHAGPGHSRMATGIDAPASTGARPVAPAKIPVRSGPVPGQGPTAADPRMPGNSLPPGTDLRTYYNK